jgi:hypothetical protein
MYIFNNINNRIVFFIFIALTVVSISLIIDEWHYRLNT